MKVPLQGECRLLTHHASGLFAVEKAAGILSHPNHSEADPGALMALPYDGTAEAYLDGGERWFLLNRLDAPTSGVVLLAHSAPLAERVKAAFAAHQVAKTYLAVVKGIPRSKSERWKDCLDRQALEGAPAHRYRQGATQCGDPHDLAFQ
jgi:23S rRNA-/tRNA-specific pseudouridylate synthase